MKWLYKRCVADFDQMTDLAKSFRERLEGGRRRRARRRSRTTQVSADGTRKWLLAMDADAGASRWCSSRSPVAARCASRARSAARWTARSARPAQQGFNRNLTRRGDRRPGVARAIASSGYGAGRRPRRHERRVHGHGRAARELSQRRARRRDPDGRPRLRHLAPPRHGQHVGPRAADLPARRGNATARSRCRCTRRTTKLRNELVPINRKHPIAELLDACWQYVEQAERAQHHVRVRDARRRQRPARARARAGAAAARTGRRR